MTVGFAPQVAFDSNAPVCLGAAVVFTNTTTGTPPIAYLWDFGDGITSTLDSPVYTYTAAGLYTVTLDAVNDFGSGQATGLVEVMETTADFTFVANGLTVTFTNASQNATSYLWSFGDTGTSTETNPVHTYADAGVYTVTLTVTGVCGTDVATQELEVSLPSFQIYLPLIMKATVIP